MAGIIVGVDGSHDAQRALEWAMREAAARHAPLTVMTVHQVSVSGWIAAPVFLPVAEPTVEHARQAAEEAVAKAAAQLGEPQPVPVTIRTVTGFPAQGLSRPRAMPTCWWWAPGATADSRG